MILEVDVLESYFTQISSVTTKISGMSPDLGKHSATIGAVCLRQTRCRSRKHTLTFFLHFSLTNCLGWCKYFGRALPPYSQISRLVCQIKRENVINNQFPPSKTVVSFVFWECIQQPKLLLWLQKRFPNQRGYVTITLPGSQRTSYFNFVPPLPSRVFRILKSTRRDKPLRYTGLLNKHPLLLI